MSERKIYLTVEETRQKLDEISSIYCGAKWTQVLFQLHLGKLYNCCLTAAQPIDKSAIFDSQQLIEEREKFIAGEKIKECHACWSAEENGYISDRIYKSSDPSAIPLYESQKRFEAKGIVPSYIEISLSNRCQFKCAYCSPENSSSLYNEVKEFGPYRTTDDYAHVSYLYRGDNFYLENDQNPYVDAFVDWFPKISNQIKILRFTGGEPLLSDRLFDIMDLLVMYPSPDLELIFNSNLGIQPKILDQFLDHIKKLPKGSYGKISIVTSLDGWGEGARLARYGLALDLFEKNYLKIREELPEAEVRFTCTVNLLALPDLKKLLEKVLDWKKSQIHFDQILITSYPLHYPAFLSPRWCRALFQEEMDEALSFMNANFSGDSDAFGFKTVEKDMLVKAFGVVTDDSNHKNLIDFTLFLLQHQYRKKWTDELLPVKVKMLLEQGKAKLLEKLKSKELDGLTALKIYQWVGGPVSVVEELLSQDLKNGLLTPWSVLDVQHGKMESISDDWVFWWVERNEPHVADKMVSLFTVERKEHFYQSFYKKLQQADEAFWFKLSNSQIILKMIPEKILMRLLVISTQPMSSGQQTFWYVTHQVRAFKN